MHRLDCDEYVDMGEHNKPLCKKNGYRPAECELCPIRVAALEAENAKLRELAKDLLKNCLESPFWPRDTNSLRIRCQHMGIEVD